MNIKLAYILLFVSTIFLLSGCKKEPKLIPISPKVNSSEKVNDANINRDVHAVVVKEILPSENNYVYLKVQEGEEQFWISTVNQEINVGETYYYNEALLKTNFESNEHNRVFDKIYLVTNLVSAAHGNSPENGTEKTQEGIAKSSKEETQSNPKRIIEQKGSIKIAELVKDPKKFEGKTVQISGECVKVNAGIMDRNWIHLKDGSKDDFDLVVTTDVIVPVGKVVTMKALVTLNKDFGAGYKYDLILENGIIIP